MRRTRNVWRRWLAAVLVAQRSLACVRLVLQARTDLISLNPRIHIWLKHWRSQWHPAQPSTAEPWHLSRRDVVRDEVQLCQALGPAAPYPIWGVDSAAGRVRWREVGWDARGMIPWQEFAQGEYVGHARTPHVPEYRLREGDLVAVYYRRTREELVAAVRDRRSATGFASNRSRPAPGRDRSARCRRRRRRRRPTTSRASSSCSPTARSRCRCWAQVRATRRTVPRSATNWKQRYKKFFREPSITVTPIRSTRSWKTCCNTVDNRGGIARRFAAAGEGDAGRRHPVAGGGQHLRAGPDAGRSPAGNRRPLRRGRAGRSGDADPGRTGAAVCVRAGRSEPAGPVRAGQGRRRRCMSIAHGRRLETRREPAASRGVPPRAEIGG